MNKYFKVIPEFKFQSLGYKNWFYTYSGSYMDFNYHSYSHVSRTFYFFGYALVTVKYVSKHGLV
jgi:hypothetical protein